MQSSSTFTKVSGPISEVKKNLDWWRFGKYFWILERIRAKQSIGKQVRFVPNTVGGLKENKTQGKFCNFFHLFKLLQNCYINKKISFPGTLAI